MLMLSLFASAMLLQAQDDTNDDDEGLDLGVDAAAVLYGAEDTRVGAENIFGSAGARVFGRNDRVQHS